MKKTIYTYIGTYREPCLDWIRENRLYNVPVHGNAQQVLADFSKFSRLNLVKYGVDPICYSLGKAKLVGRDELKALNYPLSEKPHSDVYILFELKNPKELDKNTCLAFTVQDFAKTERDRELVQNFLELKAKYTECGDVGKLEKILPQEIIDADPSQLAVFSGTQLNFIEDLFKDDNSRFREVRTIVRDRLSKTTCEKIPQEDLADGSWKDKGFAFPSRTIRLATAFSGIGAIEHAFQRLKLKHQIVFAGDIDPKCRQSYFANYDININNWFTDVCQFDATPYRGKVDIFVGGAPCQAFSMVGKRRGFEDARGTLFYDFARIIKETQPKVFIFENVRGILNHDGGRTWEVIHQIFEELGYDLHFRVLNSRDYGIPQNRERLFCVGFRTKTDFKFPAPIPLTYRMYDFLEDFASPKYFLREKGIKFVTSHKNREKSYTQVNGDVALCQKRNQEFNWHGDFVFHPLSENERLEDDYDEFIFDVRDVEEKYYLSEKVARYVLAGGTKNFRTSTKTDLDVARPILQSMHKMHRAGVDNYVTHKGRIRKLTPRECLRLMGFKDSFKIVVSDTSMYQQSGNSIVVDVLIALLKQMDVTQYGVDSTGEVKR